MSNKNTFTNWWTNRTITQKILMVFFGVIIGLSVALKFGGSSPESKWKECLEITGNVFTGACRMGYVDGSATITFDNDGKKCSVTYSAMGQEATESGTIENVELKSGGIGSANELVGDWLVNGNASEGAKFCFKILSDKPNTVLCTISNTQFMYYSYLSTSPENLLKLKEILKSDKKGTSTEVSTQSFSDQAAPAIATPSEVVPEAAATEMPATEEMFESAPEKYVDAYADQGDESVGPDPDYGRQLNIGDQYQGGIVIKVDNSGSHGLIMSNNDLGSGTWDNANKLCDAYSKDGFDDWTLPTFEELRIIYNNKNIGSKFQNNWYWSNEVDYSNPSRALHLGFINGDRAYVSKEHGKFVRAVRRF
jgi:hypothetical protein